MVDHKKRAERRRAFYESRVRPCMLSRLTQRITRFVSSLAIRSNFYVLSALPVSFIRMQSSIIITKTLRICKLQDKYDTDRFIIANDNCTFSFKGWRGKETRRPRLIGKSLFDA